eukprot:CAMPEP_0168487162 /NCGR_PEP_ID=MMETSP0228-20121227/67493_1 /TAXON_ID=133427 /ORGANISM="Protoceratium reticulatum, Strain CCCM 535 (=CCMP 1889)" /LENGTH=1180 /DNA_ID=CAMNT_0008503769 /DNA_START=55 /DNA_END=3598 /DNA_ORIENTATION=-
MPADGRGQPGASARAGNGGAAKAKSKAAADAKSAKGATGGKDVKDVKDAKDAKRVLVLTGLASGEKIMRTQLSKLIKKAEGLIEFVIYEGERECTSTEAVEIMSQFFKGLPMKMYDELIFDERHWRCYKQVYESLAVMQEAIKKLGPFHGVLGFSQGANFAVMLAAQSYAGVGMPLSFVIPMCPNAPGYADQVREWFNVPLPVPALIIRGDQEAYDEGLKKTLKGKEIDTLDEPVVSEHVVKLFKDPEIFTHPDGHRPLPSKPKDQDALIEKLMSFVLARAEQPPVVRDPGQPSGLPLGDTLRPGSLVEEMELRSTRLHYHLVAGCGPKSGWVTTKSAKGHLLVRAPDNAAGTTGEIWILTVGTRGDLQSTCCQGWSDRSQGGSQVFSTRSEPNADGQDWEQAGASVQEPRAEGQVPGVREPAMGWNNFCGLIRHLGIDLDNGGDVVNLAWLWNEMPEAIKIVREAMEGGKPDLVIYNHLMVNLGLLCWRLYGVRAIFANLGLEFHFAPRGEDSFNFNTLGAFDRMVVKRATGVSMMERMSKEEFAHLYNSKDRLLGTTKLIIYALPHEDQVVARDWKFTGFWIYDQEKQKDETDAFGGPELLEKLQNFLVDGPPPAYMGWGSMPTLPGLIVTLVKSLRNLRLRAVMAGAEAADPEGCAGLCEYAESNVLFIDKAPHEWLLPRCACSVHHGGAGTTAAAMRAGVPTIVVPLGYDQPVHGDWVERMGVGIKAPNMKVLQVAEFEEALRRATSDSEMRQKARAVAEQLQREPGVSAAVEKVRKIMREDIRTGRAKERWESEAQEWKKRKKDNFWEKMKEEEKERWETVARKLWEEDAKEGDEGKGKSRDARRRRQEEKMAPPQPQPAPVPEVEQSKGDRAGPSPETEARSSAETELKTTTDDGRLTEPEAPAAREEAEVTPVGHADAHPTPAVEVQTQSAVLDDAVKSEARTVAGLGEELEAEAAVETQGTAAPTSPPVEDSPQNADAARLAPDGEEARVASTEPTPAPSLGTEGHPLAPQPPELGLQDKNSWVKDAPEDAITVQEVPTPTCPDTEEGLKRVAEEDPQGISNIPATREELQDTAAHDPTTSTETERQALDAPLQGEFQVVIHIDRGLELQTVMSLQHGTTVRQVKELLANDDPTGETTPQDIRLLSPATGCALDDATPVAGFLSEVDVAASA